MMNFCPKCGENLTKYSAVATEPTPEVAEYDQVKTWKKLVADGLERKEDPPTTQELINHAIGMRHTVATFPQQSIVHLLFDRPVTPRGGLLAEIAQVNGHLKVNADRLRSMGYAVEDGKVKMVDNVPVGEIYNLLQYWGGVKQHKRWHLAEPVRVNPSRNGDPCFMDEAMVAFGAVWKDDLKWSEGLHTLLDYFVHGVKPDGNVTAIPLVLHVVWQ